MSLTYTPVVQADLSGTAYGAAPTFTDISRFVLTKGNGSPISTQGGRQDEYSDVNPTTCTLILDNDALIGDATAPNAGRFSPGLSSSPFYPHIDIDVRIRVGITLLGTTYWWFDGYITRWVPSYVDGAAIVTVIAADWLARGAKDRPLNAWAIELAMAKSPIAMYAMQEAAGATTFGDLTGTLRPAYLQTNSGAGTVGTAAAGAQLGLADGLTALQLTPGDANGLAGPYILLPDNPLPTAAAFSVSLFVKTPTTPLASTAFVLASTAGVASQFGYVRISLTGAGVGGGSAIAQVGGSGLSPPSTIVSGGPNICDGKWHHLALALAADQKTLTAYVDGALIGTNAAASAMTIGPIIGFCLGAAYSAFTQDFSFPLATTAGGPVAFGGVSMHNAVLTATDIANIAAAGFSALNGTGTSAVLALLATLRTNTGMNASGTVELIGSAGLAGKTAPAALLDLAKTELGYAYIDGLGVAQLLGASKLWNPAVSITLDASQDRVNDSAQFPLDDTRLINDATITRPGGAAQRVVDSSETQIGIYSNTDTINAVDDTAALNAAGWRVNNNKTRQARPANLIFDLLTETSSAVAAAVLGAKPLQRIALTNLPASAPPTTDSIIQGWAAQIGVDVMTITLNTSPLPVPVFTWDGDAAHGWDSGAIWAPA